jgi:hypothetical protein
MDNLREDFLNQLIGSSVVGESQGPRLGYLSPEERFGSASATEPW